MRQIDWVVTFFHFSQFVCIICFSETSTPTHEKGMKWVDDDDERREMKTKSNLHLSQSSGTVCCKTSFHDMRIFSLSIGEESWSSFGDAAFHFVWKKRQEINDEVDGKVRRHLIVRRHAKLRHSPICDIESLLTLSRRSQFRYVISETTILRDSNRLGTRLFIPRVKLKQVLQQNYWLNLIFIVQSTESCAEKSQKQTKKPANLFKLHTNRRSAPLCLSFWRRKTDLFLRLYTHALRPVQHSSHRRPSSLVETWIQSSEHYLFRSTTSWWNLRGNSSFRSFGLLTLSPPALVVCTLAFVQCNGNPMRPGIECDCNANMTNWITTHKPCGARASTRKRRE